VWTPWTEKANKMGDMGQLMVGVKWFAWSQRTAIENVVEVKAGTKHALIVEYRAESF